MKKKFKLPFALMPASWGLSGKAYEKAKAEYYYKPGIDLDKRLAEIEFDDEKDVKLAHLEIELKHEKISETQYEKSCAEVKQEPYVNVIKMGVNDENVAQGYFELDWNDEFIKMLQNAGLEGRSDEEIVNKWFNAVCRTVLIQEKADLDYGLQPGGDNGVIRKQNPPTQSPDAE